jgi:hypothetical protein
MARKKRRRRQTLTPPQQQREAPQHPDRRALKEEVRRAKDQARRRVRRRATARRVGVPLALLLLAIAVFVLLTRAGAPGEVGEVALRAAREAGCGDIQTPEQNAPGSLHAAPGETVTSTQLPPTSGRHYGNQVLPPTNRVYDSPVDEIAAIHNLEHGYVVLYYRSKGKEALGSDVVDRLATFARNQEKVILAPSTSLRPQTALALTAWNKLWECPGDVTPEQAATMASGFVEAYRETSNAPEPFGA